jgi:formylglycine-generating enzyme required for sulfatase activity
VLVQYGLRRPLAMTAINGGIFTMGNDSGGTAEMPAHRVTVSPFSLLTTEITTESFLLLTGSSPLSSPDSALAPARNMTWFDAVLFCNTLSKRRGFDTCYRYTGILPSGTIDNSLTCDFLKSGYRLPTEAEWEYACRAGSATPFFWGDVPDTSYAWMSANSGGVPQPVATRLPNPWGLYDMSGNVSEWVNDVYVPYTAGPQTDPRGITYGTYHTQRGGSAPTSGVTGQSVTSTIRDNGDASLAYYYNGFRVAAKQ